MIRRSSVVLALGVLSCRTVPPRDTPLNAVSENPPRAGGIQENAKWDAYVDQESKSYPHQAACLPASFAHQGKWKGMVVLFHGFTACPQQYFDVAETLTRRGWDVFLPTNPGHGMVRHSETQEDTYLPTQDDATTRFKSFVRTINDFARSYDAPVKVVGGLSLGGALATAAVAEDPRLYQRALILTPFYAMAKPFSYFLGTVKNVNGVVQAMAPDGPRKASRQTLDQSVGWGPKCENEALAGRQGICHFKVKHLMGSQQFGFDLSETQRISGKVQFVGVEDDPAIDNDRMIWFFNTKVDRKTSPADLCFYPKGTNHSLLSRFDTPDEKKFWLADFSKSLVAFVDTGTFFAKADATIKGFSQCYLH